ncbi:hypothetical protein [Anaeromyxobacter terrae]|uniref:hypothetical protein n=1 Tax=Anaeromyxobacter terrae TaxID=2925406 RepID=UPI001F5A9397|nr:hypothetical protein [Anaeromyxobacter sp. SG22]
MGALISQPSRSIQVAAKRHRCDLDLDPDVDPDPDPDPDLDLDPDPDPDPDLDLDPDLPDLDLDPDLDRPIPSRRTAHSPRPQRAALRGGTSRPQAGHWTR